MSHDPRVDAYIARQADFARPILAHIRAAMHASGLPIDEDIKWGMPAFTYDGKPLAGMAAFKAHATLGFWDREQVSDGEAKAGAMGDFGRLTSIADLPDEAALHALITRAAALIDAGARPVRNKSVKDPLPVPADLAAALVGNDAARRSFEAFAPSARRDYLEWLVEAKRPETRARRLVQAVEWMAEGKKRNWKYERC